MSHKKLIEEIIGLHFENRLMVHPRVFGKKLENFLTIENKQKINQLLAEDKVFFKELISSFYDTNLNNSIFEIESYKNKDSFNYFKELKNEGVVKIPNLFSEEDLSDLITFSEWIENSIGDDIHHSGGIGIQLLYNQSSNTFQFGNPYHSKIMPNYGNTRLGSKQWKIGENNRIFPPGTDCVRNNELIRDIMSLYCNNGSLKPWRMTMDWISPAEYNHNGWHIDKIRSHCKVFVLLDDVSLNTGPMYFAKKSHKMINDLETDVKYHLFVHQNEKKCLRDGVRYGKNLSAVNGSHSGYLPDNLADNNSRKVSPGKVKLAEETYDKFLMEGKKGDAVIFDTAGFHRGNFVAEGVRKTINLTFDHDATFLGTFFDKIGKTKF